MLYGYSDCNCPFQNRFQCVVPINKFLWVSFLVYIPFNSYRKICGKKSGAQLSIADVPFCGSVWTKSESRLPTTSSTHTHISRKAIANAQQQKHVSIYVVPVLNYMCRQCNVIALRPRPVCMRTWIALTNMDQ